MNCWRHTATRAEPRRDWLTWNVVETTGTVWVLDSSTKGTGATMVPLENALGKPSKPAETIFVPSLGRPQPRQLPEPRRPHLFKVVDIATRQVLSEGVNVRMAIEVLNGVRSIVDVNVYVWRSKTEKWRLLTFHERRLLWDWRDDAVRAADVSA